MLSLRLVVGNVVRTLGSGGGNTLTYDLGQHVSTSVQQSKLFNFVLHFEFHSMFVLFVCLRSWTASFRSTFKMNVGWATLFYCGTP